jgi:hypothetical protein
MPRKQPQQPEDNGPDTARVYERARPEAEAGMGELRAIPCRPAKTRDKMHSAVGNRQKLRQLNAEDVISSVGGVVPGENVPTDERAIKGKQRNHKS